MTDLPVLVAGQRRDVVLDGTTYTVRALTYGEASALQLARHARRPPSVDIINDALREAALAAGRADLAEAIAELDEAEDALAAHYAAAPPATDDEGLRRWRAETAAELSSLQRAAIRAQRKRRRALELYGATERLAELQRQADAALRAYALDLVAVGLCAIDGKQVTLDEAAVAALPSAHIPTLSAAVSELLAPTEDAGKN
jgi:hypothetical protein